MKTLGRTCTLWALVYFALAGLVAWLVYERVPRPQPALIAGAIAGFFLWVAAANIAGVRSKSIEARQIRAAMQGGPPQDGERVAVTGYVSGKLESLVSPITRTRCVAYEYKAVPAGNQQLAAWQGVALVPATIDGPNGSVRVLALPEFEFDSEPTHAVDHRRNFQEYVANTTFTEQVGIDFRRDLSHFKTINTDDAGRIRDDVHALADADVNTVTLTEKVLRQGDRVVAFGKYSSARGGLVPDEDAMMRSVRILKGAPEDVLRKLSRKGPVELLWGCGCLLPVIVAAVIAIIAVPLPALEQMFPEKDPSWAEVRIEKKVRALVTRLGLMPQQGTTVLELDRGSARGKVTRGGRTTHFERASAVRTRDGVDVTVTGDDTVAVFRFTHDAKLFAMELDGVRVPEADAEVEIQRNEEQEITGRVTLLSPKNDPSLRVAFSAFIEER